VGMRTSSDFIGNTGGNTYATPQLYKAYESVINHPAKTDVSPDLRRERNIPGFRWGTATSNSVAPPKTIYAYNAYYDRFPGKWRREEEKVTPKDRTFTTQ